MAYEDDEDERESTFDEDFPESENVEDRRGEEPDTIRDAGRELGAMGRYLASPEDWNIGGRALFDGDRKRARRQMGLDFRNGGSVPGYEDGGAVEDMAGDADEYGALGDFEEGSQGDSISTALRAVNEALIYGRQRYGLLGQKGGGGRPRQSFEDGGEVLEEDEFLPENAQETQAIIPNVPMEGERDIPVEGPEDPYQGNRVERAFNENVVAPVREFGRDMGRRILGYLQSADADPQMSRRAESEVDPEGVLDEDTRKLLAVQLAQQRGGSEASWRVLQDYRKKYDGYRAFAAAALQNQDLPGAARAATQAYPNILDGTSISFQPGQGGVTAVIRPREGEPQQLQLSPEQFNRWLTGDEGQYDMVLARGGPAQLQQLLQAQARPAQPGATAQPGAPRPPGASPAPPRRADPALNRQAQSQQVEVQPTDDELLRRQFPWASQGDQLAQAQLSMREKGRDRESRLEQRVAPAEIRAAASTENTNARVAGQRDVAAVRGQAYDRRTQQVYEAAMARTQQQAQRGQNTEQLRRESNAMRAIVEKLRNNMELTPQEQQVHERIMLGAQGDRPGGGAPPAQPQRPGAQPQQRGAAPQQPAARPPGAAFRDQQGRFYDKFGRPL